MLKNPTVLFANNKPDRLLLFCGTAILVLLYGIATVSSSLKSEAFEAAAVYFLSVAILRKNPATSVPLIILLTYNAKPSKSRKMLNAFSPRLQSRPNGGKFVKTGRRPCSDAGTLRF